MAPCWRPGAGSKTFDLDADPRSCVFHSRYDGLSLASWRLKMGLEVSKIASNRCMDNSLETEAGTCCHYYCILGDSAHFAFLSLIFFVGNCFAQKPRLVFRRLPHWEFGRRAQCSGLHVNGATACASAISALCRQSSLIWEQSVALQGGINRAFHAAAAHGPDFSRRSQFWETIAAKHKSVR